MVYLKHKQIQKTFLDNLKLEAATETKVEFFYNDRGQRMKKISYGADNFATTTFYVRDASGSVMGIYQGNSSPSGRYAPPSLQENTIFGSGRIGVFKRTPGKYQQGYALYEITDHLGNVRAVIQKTAQGLLALTNKTDYYPFGMPMPNKTTTDGLYRYAFQGQEKDPETGMEAFELRLWDGRLGRWNTIDPAGEFHSPYLGMGNDPINAIDPDGGDIIYLNDSKAVNPTGKAAFGHAAVLIGNDKDGWRYVSMNGTSKNIGDAPKAVGDSYYADLGDTKGQNDFRGSGLTAKQVMERVNTSNKKITSHNYDRAVRIKTTTAEDEIAYQAAKKQASGKTYGILGSSCIDVPQEAFLSVVNKRLNESSDWKLNFIRPSQGDMGFNAPVPNLWFNGFFGDNFMKNHMNVINNFLTNDFQFSEISANPRYH